MKKNNVFVENYNCENNLNVKEILDIYDECSFSYLDILKGKEVEVTSKIEKECKCTESVNFNIYYERCTKCNGLGYLVINGNKVICNHCKGEKRIVKNACPLCEGKGKIISKGKVKVQLNSNLKEGDIVSVKGKGKISSEVKGDLFIKVKINDLDHFDVVNDDVYDKRIIKFSKEEMSKGICKNVETIKGIQKIKSNGEENLEVIKLENQGLNNGDFYVCIENELIPLKGKDVYKNVVINKEMLGFYLSKDELASDLKCLTTYYYKKINDLNYVYIRLEEPNNFKIIKLKGKGLNGKFGGENGDLYLRVYFEENFKCINDVLYSKPIKLTKYEVGDGKKIVEFDKNKISLSFEKNLQEEKEIEIKEYGFMLSKSEFDKAIFRVNPFNYDIYKVSVKVNKKDKTIYLKDYKKYFYEEVNTFDEGLKVNLNKSKECVAFDEEGNKVIVRIIR